MASRTGTWHVSMNVIINQDGPAGRAVNGDAVGEVLTALHSPFTAPPLPAGSRNGTIRLTGPMIVACQWNCKREELNVSISSIIISKSSSNNPTRYAGLRGHISAPRYDKATLGTKRPTRTRRRRTRGIIPDHLQQGRRSRRTGDPYRTQGNVSFSSLSIVMPTP
jgi:hypothetical protein